MTLGQAVTRSILPALAIGPLLGLIGAMGVGVYLAATTQGAPNFAETVALIATFAVMMGLIIASPLAFVFGTALLLLSGRQRRWFHPLIWGAAGLVVGAIAGGLIGSGSAEELRWLASILGVLGAIGAILFRWMVRKTLRAATGPAAAEAFV